jgi:hypothetical protein
MDRILHGEARFYQGVLIDLRVIVVIMCFLVLELLCQAATRWIPALYYQVHLGECGPVLSCQAFNAAVSRGPDPCSSSWY